MIIEEAVFYQLKNTAGLTAFVGLRIYPMIAPEGTELPYVIYQKISNPQMHNSGVDTGAQCPRFQVSVYANNYDSMKAVSVQILVALKDFSGTMGGAGGVYVERSFYEDENDLYDENMKVCGNAIDFIIWHE